MSTHAYGTNCARRHIDLDESVVLDELSQHTHDERFRRAMRALANDRVLLCHFLVGLSRGEALGEAGVSAIGEEEIARLIHGLDLQRLEEHGHSQGALELARRVCPELFAGDTYRYEASVAGAGYYYTVLQANRARLRARDRYSRLNLYLTTSFGYEIMVELLFGSVIEALNESSIPGDIIEQAKFVLGVILSQEEGHLGLLDQHNALLDVDRTGLSPRAVDMLEALARLDESDYRWTADLAVREMLRFNGIFADPARIRECLERGVSTDDLALAEPAT